MRKFLETSRPPIDPRELLWTITNKEAASLLRIHQQLVDHRDPYELLDFMIRSRTIFDAIPAKNIPSLSRLMNPRTKSSAMSQIDFTEALLHENLADLSLRLHTARQTDGQQIVLPQKRTNKLTRGMDYLIYEQTGRISDLRKADTARRWTPDGILVDRSSNRISRVCEHTRSTSNSYVRTKQEKAAKAVKEYPEAFRDDVTCLFSVQKNCPLPLSEDEKFEMRYDPHTLRTDLLRRVLRFYRAEGLCDDGHLRNPQPSPLMPNRSAFPFLSR